MEAVIDPVLEHARTYAREALRVHDPERKPEDHVDLHLDRYRSQARRHAFLTAALLELDAQLQTHLEKDHQGDAVAIARCQQRPRHAHAKAMVEDRLQAIDEQRNPLFGRTN
jgi:hypothetical protein